MRTTKRLTSTVPSGMRSAVGRAALVVAVAAVWVLLAPSSFGGQTAYVIVAGASMEPTLHQGDLVLARRASAYDVGQVVTYTHPQVGPVIHRIIDRQGAHYLLQGDNNSWIDSYAPSAEEVVGGSWVVIRRGGTLLMTLRTPAGLAVLSLLFGAIFVMTIGRSGLEAKSGRSTGSDRAVHRDRPVRPPDGAILTLAVLAFGSLLLSIAAFTRPTTETVPGEAAFQHRGRFSYHAGAPATVYSGASLETGDPIFDALVPSFAVEFDYELASAEPADIRGVVALTLEVSEPNGWRRSLPLQPETPFAGTSVHAEGVVDMVTIRRMISLLEGATALDRDAYRVDVVADVRLDGDLAGHAFQSAFTPALPFALDDFQMYLRQGDTPEGGESDPTTPTEDGFLAFPVVQAATITILGAEVPVTTARAVSVAGLVAALGIGAVLILPYLRARERGETARVLAEFDGMLVAVTEPPASTEMIEVRAFGDLARLSERTGRMILHCEAGPEHHFYLQDDGVTYHLRLIDMTAEGGAGGSA